MSILYFKGSLCLRSAIIIIIIPNVEVVMQKVADEMVEFFSQPNAFRSLLILALSLVVAFYISKYIALIIIKIAKIVARQSDTASDYEKKVHLRRIETYLSVLIAMVRVVVVGIVAFYAWQRFSPAVSLGTAAIGASAFFIVLAGGTLGMILRDITAGSTMIIERWFNVGDFIRVEPFLDVSGVVERMTLRSTRIRSLNGDIIWIHNQHMQSVKVAQRGLRTIAVDVFVNNGKSGRKLIEKAIATMPVGTMKLASVPRISREEQWGERIWLFTVIGETPPGREWLMENYFIESLKELDERSKGIKSMIRPPIVRFADAEAEKSFKRAIKNSQ